MLMIVAVIQPCQLQRVKAELVAVGVSGMTVSECAGHGRAPKLVASVRGGPDLGYLEDNIQIEVAVPEAAREAVIESICHAASSGNGGGKIFVASIDKVISIRTGQDDDLALKKPSHPAWVEAAE